LTDGERAQREAQCVDMTLSSRDEDARAAHADRGQRPRHELLALLRDALDGDGFVVCAQPIVDLATGRSLKHELSLFLPGGDGRLIEPSYFHPVAERFGLTTQLDDVLIRRGGALARDGDAVALDINAATVPDPDPDLGRRTEQVLAEAGASPGLITLELPEESLTRNAPAALAFAERMHALGCSITADGFGAISVGFGHLKRLPLDCLKIDPRFVEDLEFTPSDEQFVQAFVQLAREFGITAAADGVGDAATRDIVRGAGVQQGQGALFGEPTPLPAGGIAALSALRGRP
jgi:EAL domain-containing protein (putative c-di-GMP-specific phosphodiesterase class I)